jgi:type IV pilus assembly protein PilN
MQISLNLATRPFADLGPAIKRLRIAMGALAVISLGLGVGLHFFHHKAELARARDHSLDGAIGRIESERQKYINLMHQPDNAQLLSQAQMLNGLFDQKSFSWTLAMEDLETVLPGGVQVTQIEPKVDKQGKITISLRVIGPRDREVELVQNLEHSRRFLLPRIVGETAEASSGPNNQQLEAVSASNRFNFDILADYNPAQPGERKPAKPPVPLNPLPGSQAHAAARPAQAVPLNPARGPATGPAAGQPPGFRPGRPPYTGPPRPAPQQPLPGQGTVPAARPQPIPKPSPGGPQ